MLSFAIVFSFPMATIALFICCCQYVTIPPFSPSTWPGKTRLMAHGRIKHGFKIEPQCQPAWWKHQTIFTGDLLLLLWNKTPPSTAGSQTQSQCSHCGPGEWAQRLFHQNPRYLNGWMKQPWAREWYHVDLSEYWTLTLKTSVLYGDVQVVVIYAL